MLHFRRIPALGMTVSMTDLSVHFQEKVLWAPPLIMSAKPTPIHLFWVNQKLVRFVVVVFSWNIGYYTQSNISDLKPNPLILWIRKLSYNTNVVSLFLNPLFLLYCYCHYLIIKKKYWLLYFEGRLFFLVIFYFELILKFWCWLLWKGMSLFYLFGLE